MKMKASEKSFDAIQFYGSNDVCISKNRSERFQGKFYALQELNLKFIFIFMEKSKSFKNSIEISVIFHFPSNRKKNHLKSSTSSLVCVNKICFYTLIEK